MKQQNIIQRLCLLLFALVLVAPTWAQGGSGDESETITIASKADWQAFCTRVNDGETTLNAKMTADVDLGTEIVMVASGIDSDSYEGTFDGQGHTLSFNWDAGSMIGIAPFYKVFRATIKNLRTQGKITTSRRGLSGLVYNASQSTLSRCVSDVKLTGGNEKEPIQAAGLICNDMALGGGSNTLTDCIVKGSITNLSPKTSYAMAGVTLGAGATMTNCLYLGTNNAEGEGNYTFGAGSNPTLTNCYFLNRCGEGQGEFASSWRLESGEITHRLQGDRTEQVWGQTLGTDNIPLLTDEATKRVYEVKFTYNGEVKDMRYANSGQGISGGMPSFYIPSLAGEGYNPHHYYTLSFGGGFSASTPIDADRTVEITLTEQDCFTIATVDDWKELCNIVNNGEQNAIDVKMTQDIDLGTEIVMVASESSYEGTFDGQGHTLSFNWDAGSMIGIAPFYRVSHATIKNLRTQGQITANGSGLSGLVYAAGESTLSRCVSDVKLTGGAMISGPSKRRA